MCFLRKRNTYANLGMCIWIKTVDLTCIITEEANWTPALLQEVLFHCICKSYLFSAGRPRNQTLLKLLFNICKQYQKELMQGAQFLVWYHNYFSIILSKSHNDAYDAWFRVISFLFRDKINVMGARCGTSPIIPESKRQRQMYLCDYGPSCTT